MSSNVPTERKIAWISLIPHVLLIGFFILIWYQIFPEVAFMLGALTYLILSFSLRTFIPIDQRNGMKHIIRGHFEAAIVDFEKSYDFFDRNEWIDKYRFVTMLSSSKMTYKEMALVNIAFCYGQLGNKEKAKEYYKRILREFPDNSMAQTAMRMLNSPDSAK